MIPNVDADRVAFIIVLLMTGISLVLYALHM